MNSETEDGNKSMELLIEEETKEANRDNSQSQRINEFINDLKEAIESGKLHQTNMLQQSAAQLNKLINVDNLSNQTFTYIINWLKQQQEKKTNLNFTNKEEEELYGHHSDINLASDVAEEVDKGVVVVEVVDDSEDSGEMDLATEIKFLRNKIKASELDKDKMMAKINELQKENLDLKTKLLMRPGQQSYSLPLDDATQNEINNLKILVQELIKSNDEKDKKLDELTKQVIRFKRIQEIVLSAQAPIKSKNYDDLSFEMNPPSTTSQSATAATTTTTTMTEIHMTHSSYATAPNGAMTTQLDDNQHTSSSSSAGSSNKADQQQPQESAQQKQTGTSNADPTSQIISSCSLTSSISSSSSSASSSSSTSSASSDSSINSAQHHHQSPATTTTTSNNAPLTAPLATITEFINYSSSSTLATPNPSLTCSQHNNNRQHNLSSDTLTNVDALNTMSMSTANTGQQQQTEPSKQQQKSVEGMKTISNPIKEKLLFEAAFGKSSKSISKSASNKAAKYSSAVSLSATSSPNQNEYTNSKKHSALNSFKLTLSPNKSNNTSTNHHSSNRSLRNFFGKLIRTSLVNINESTFGGQNNSSSNNNNKHEGNSQTLDNKAVSLQQQLQVQMPTSPKTPSSSSNPFKRGGLRSTANARLQNAYTYGGSRHHHHHGSNNNEATSSSVIAVPSHVDMLTFAKWPSAHVCEWLARHGFDAYFPVNTESGQRVNKFIKNGLQLLQATQYDYERELGIKNPLHRKKLGILLQGLYSTLSPDPNNCQTIEQINLTQLDQHWVTKWLDDIGLPQYKDTFNEHMIDGRMLHHLSQEDFATLSINSELHYLSIKWAIHVLRLNNFDPHCLRRRPSGDEALDRAECSLWTNHRCMEWLRSIDLSEYAPNLRGSGVHGGLLVFEARFNPQCLADILSIPASKTLLRRHLSTLFSDLIGPEMCKLKRDAQSQSGYVQLTAQSKVKHVKPKSSGHHHHHSHQHGGSGLIFTNALGGTHKRTKSQDSRDFLGLPMALVDKLNQQQLQHQQHQQMMIARASSKTMNVGQSATLPLGSSSIYSDNIEEVSNKSTTIKYVR